MKQRMLNIFQSLGFRVLMAIVTGSVFAVLPSFTSVGLHAFPLTNFIIGGCIGALFVFSMAAGYAAMRLGPRRAIPYIALIALCSLVHSTIILKEHGLGMLFLTTILLLMMFGSSYAAAASIAMDETQDKLLNLRLRYGLYLIMSILGLLGSIAFIVFAVSPIELRVPAFIALVVMLICVYFMLKFHRLMLMFHAILSDRRQGRIRLISLRRVTPTSIFLSQENEREKSK